MKWGDGVEIGALLKQAREEKSYSLKDVEKATKIRMKYLKALEAEEFDVLPGHVYTIGFIKNYADFLGLDKDELVLKYKQISKHEEDKKTILESKKALQNSKKNKKKINKTRYTLYIVSAIILCLLLILAVAYIIVFWESNQNQKLVDDVKEQQQSILDRSNGLDGVVQDEQMNNQIVDSKDKVEVELKVVDERCWMKIEVDGKEEFKGMLNAGDVKEFTGNEYVLVRLGNAGVVDVKVDGKDLGFLAQRGIVIEQRFEVQK